MSTLHLLFAIHATTLCLLAQSPTVSTAFPCGGQRGTEVTVKFGGRRIAQAQDLFLYRDGIEVREIKRGRSNNSVEMRLKIADDCPLGEHPFRIRTDRGITNMKLLHVGTLPERPERGSNNTRDTAEPIPLNVTVNGIVGSEDVDWFRVEVPSGSRVHFEVQGVRLGLTSFDPFLAIYDEAGARVVESDDTAFGRMDPLCTLEPSEGGVYFVELRESAYGGGSSSIYRMHVGTFARPVAAIPAGGRPGEEIEVTLVGDGPPRKETVKLPKGQRYFSYFPQNDSGAAPTPIQLSLFGAAGVMESVGADAAPAIMKIPGAADGVLREPGEVDRFRFKAKKGERIVIRAVARALRSPVDPVIAVTRGDSRSENDDNRGRPDSNLTFRARADGEHVLTVRDHLGRSGPDHFYRIEAYKPGKPMSTRSSLRRDHQWVSVPAGGRMMTVVSASNPIEGSKLILEGLPPDVSYSVGTFGNGASTVPLVLEAADDASLGGGLVSASVLRPGKDAAQHVHYSDFVRLVVVRNNQTYLSRIQRRLPVAVTERAPFEVELVAPAVPLVRGGPMKLRVELRRREGFKSAVRFKLPWMPPGVTANEVSIPAGKTSAEVSLSVKDSAREGRWKLAGYGYATIDGGVLRAGTGFVEVEVASRWMKAKLGKVRVDRGDSAELAVELKPAKPFDGEAKCELVGLPKGVSAEAQMVAADATRLVFPLRVDAKAAVGKHRPLLRIAVPSSGGGEIVHYFRGGELRVYKPVRRKAVAKPTAAKKPAKGAKSATGTVAKPKT